jgi:TetR/AcrR family transcriptional regulator, regulator of cefoperazone and chloramphenicol sensitivity
MEGVVGNQKDSEQTKAALIQAAGELFAERGYSGVTARQVVTRAGVSLGAIPYHFGSMEVLYRETLIEACKASTESDKFRERADHADPQEALRLAVAMSLEGYWAADVPWQVKLIEREFLDPSESFRDVIRLKLRPDWVWLCGIVGRAVGLPADSEAVAFGAITMHTLASTFLTYRRSIKELAPSLLRHTDRLDKLALVITSMTVDAIDRYAAQFEAPPSKTRLRKPKSANVSHKKETARSVAKAKKP